MTTKITRDVLESYLSCKYKGCLKQAGQEGTRSDCERLLLERRADVRLKSIDRIMAKQGEDDVVRNVALSASALKRGPLYVLDATLEDDVVSLVFDGLKRVDGPSKLGAFHYVPILFHEGRQVRKEQRLLLEVCGLLLARVQGRTPGYGIVWHGKGVRATRVRLGPDPRKAAQVLRELQQVRGGEPPRLLLNDHCPACEFRQRCRQQALQEDSLSLLRGMGEKEVKRYARKGILTLTQLAHTFRPRRKGKRASQRSNHRYHALQALAIRDKRIYVFGTPEVRDSPVKVYLDIEGVPDEDFIYLIGLVIVRDGSEERFSFWADTKEQEPAIFEQCLAEIGRHENLIVYTYGSYERAFLKRMRKVAKRKKPVDRLLERLVNVLSLVHAHVYFPCHSNGLKDVGGCLGCTWSEPDASGLQSLVWRARWEATREEHWKQKLLTYNLEDCAALQKVAELVHRVAAPAPNPDSPPPGNPGMPQVARVQELDRWANDRKWARVNFVHPEFNQINDCAYFDYQRERVFVRTSPVVRRNLSKGKACRNRLLRVSQRVTVTSSKCPSCGSTEVRTAARGEEVGCRVPRVRRAFDLVFTAGGIKRKVIECRTAVYRCLHCGLDYVPERHERLDKHFHGLKAWAMYQHVAHRLSLGMAQTMLLEFFGLRVFDSEIHMFKELMARYYRATYRGLLRKILSGNLLHIDETEVRLRTGKGYVWVFANLEEVVFMYRPSREGDFLRELLQDFHGVLVSDFFAAYDSYEGPQQRCLIHLIRDMNQELLNNPYDEELRSVTGPFGVLLRAIVATIDEHGLKRLHLAKHERAVTEFFRQLEERPLQSEAAEGLRERLLKNRDRLFTFLKYDGVPWNNNNAENAIKQFAYYRENTVGSLTESGLRDYLLLLSICQTCRYKGVSFLKFLLSRERDVDVFCERRRSRRSRSVLEMYPKGFIPSHFRFRVMSRRRRQQRAETAREGVGEQVASTEDTSRDCGTRTPLSPVPATLPS